MRKRRLNRRPCRAGPGGAVSARRDRAAPWLVKVAGHRFDDGARDGVEDAHNGRQALGRPGAAPVRASGSPQPRRVIVPPLTLKSRRRFRNDMPSRLVVRRPRGITTASTSRTVMEPT